MDGSTDRFVRGCTEASVGYVAAATAAYTDMACRAFDFWSTALSGLVPEAEREPVPPVADPVVALEPPFGLSFADWSPFAWLEPRRYDAPARITGMSNPVEAMMAMAGFTPLRGSPSSWGVARLMIDSGVPRAIAWPAAEASAAALDAADAASSGVRAVLASYHTEGGYAGALTTMAPSAVAAMVMMGVVSYAPPTQGMWPSLFG